LTYKSSNFVFYHYEKVAKLGASSFSFCLKLLLFMLPRPPQLCVYKLGASKNGPSFEPVQYMLYAFDFSNHVLSFVSIDEVIN
jgi:hypothetical protein